MPIEVSRAKLRLRLISDKAFNQGEESSTLALINEWWSFYKAWERDDTFLRAFKEGRMTVRQGPLSQTYGDYEKTKGDVAFSARRGDVEKKPYPNERYRTGVDSLKQRLKPSSFGMEHGERLKYKHGLHDLSGSLCTPTIPNITKQLRWKWGDLEKYITIFMPMAKPPDIEVFHLLNTMAKQARTQQPLIYDRVAELRKRMTRIKLAEKGDIGAGLHDVAPDGATKPKLRYGMKAVPDQAGVPTGVDLARHEKALDYTSILPLPTKKSNMNEIVIAYRHHEGTRFPLFTQWNSEWQAFVCLRDEPSSNYIVDGLIPDEWARTIQV